MKRRITGSLVSAGVVILVVSAVVMQQRLGVSTRPAGASRPQLSPHVGQCPRGEDERIGAEDQPSGMRTPPIDVAHGRQANQYVNPLDLWRQGRGPWPYPIIDGPAEVDIDEYVTYDELMRAFREVDGTTKQSILYFLGQRPGGLTDVRRVFDDEGQAKAVRATAGAVLAIHGDHSLMPYADAILEGSRDYGELYAASTIVYFTKDLQGLLEYYSSHSQYSNEVRKIMADNISSRVREDRDIEKTLALLHCQPDRELRGILVYSLEQIAGLRQMIELRDREADPDLRERFRKWVEDTLRHDYGHCRETLESALEVVRDDATRESILERLKIVTMEEAWRAEQAK